MVDIATAIPSRIAAGDKVVFRRSLADYPADVWTLTVELRGAGGAYTWTGSNSAGDHLVEVAAATTALYSSGAYHWHAYVTSGADRRRVERGTLTIDPDFAELGAVDQRTHAEKVVASIEAVIEGRATKDQESYTIAGRSLARTPVADLLLLRDRYRAEIERERRAERMRRGLGGPRRVVARLA